MNPSNKLQHSSVQNHRLGYAKFSISIGSILAAQAEALQHLRFNDGRWIEHDRLHLR
jgi:hypothetical protein